MRWQAQLLCFLVLLHVRLSLADDQQRHGLVGKQFCPQVAKGYFGIGLVRQENLYLATQEVSNTGVLMILRYSASGAACANILDAVDISSKRRTVEFSCADPKHPGLIIVGEMAAQGHWKVRKTNRSWRVDIEQKRILPYPHPVTCQNVSYAGTDDGEDLASWARKRANKK